MKPGEIDRQIISVPFTRIDDAKRMVYGYASTGRIDTYDTIFEPSWWPQAVIGYKGKLTISAMHLDVNGDEMRYSGREPMVAGTVPILEVDEKGLWIGAEVQEERTWEKIKNGEYNGFSVACFPYEYREETVSGRTIVRFTKYHLSDITVGYPAANLDAVFQMVMERLAVDDSSPWDWDWTADADAIIAQLGWEGLAKACLYQDSGKDPKTKDAYKLPIAKMKEGALTMYWNGVRAAMARLLGGGGPIDIPEEDRKKIYKKLKSLYKKFGKEAPEYRLETAGGEMSKFAEKINALVKRLTGKDPDATTAQEITRLEQELTTEQAAQITTIEGTVTDIATRLKAAEERLAGLPPTVDPAKVTTIEGTVTDIATRLKAAEERLARSQQPGEGNSPAPAKDGKDVFSGSLFGAI